MTRSPFDAFMILCLRLLILLGAAAATAWATVSFAQVVEGDGFSIFDAPSILIFAVLFYWIAMNFLAVLFGFIRQLVLGQPHPDLFDHSGRDASTYAGIPRTAVVVPVYNEDPCEVFAGVEAMHDGVARFGLEDKFDFFVLSDTTNPDVWMEEEHQLVQIRRRVGPSLRIHYRRRPKNVERKAGNIEDFVRRWGRSYRYMIVLDADSTMSGLTMAEMVHRMEADSRIGILQVPPVPASRRSLFARMQQFSSAFYGSIFASGFRSWTQASGNYFGHNAIIRIRAFAEHCKLPHLPGPPPLGGEILSHDFVEAALIHRAGYKVILADDLPGSYEECPTTLLDFAIRDQRWCQGNMQHLKLVLRKGFHWISRLHLLTGAMAYISSPLWALFLLCGIVGAGTSELSPDAASPDPESARIVARALLVLGVTMAMLFLPKLMAFVVMLRNPWMAKLHGGARSAAASILVESAISVVMAPVMMVYHTMFVLNTLCGRKVKWDAQSRGDKGITLTEGFRQHWVHAIAGLAGALLTIMMAPWLLVPLLPILLGLVAAGPLAWFLSLIEAGDALRARGVFLTRGEVATPFVLARKLWHLAHLREEADAQSKVDPLLRIVRSPVLNAVHLTNLELHAPADKRTHADRKLCQKALLFGSESLRPDEKMALLGDAKAMRWLHRNAWTGGA